MKGAPEIAIRRLSPLMSPEQVLARVRQLREMGLDDVQLDTQIGQWRQTHDVLTRELNGWLFTREARFYDGIHDHLKRQTPQRLSANPG